MSAIICTILARQYWFTGGLTRSHYIDLEASFFFYVQVVSERSLTDLQRCPEAGTPAGAVPDWTTALPDAVAAARAEAAAFCLSMVQSKM